MTQQSFRPSGVPPLPSQSTSPQSSQGLATASMVLGIVSVLGGIVLLVPPILAVIFGIVALTRAGKDPALGGKGRAISGLVMGGLSIVVIPIVGLLAAMAIPAFQKVRESSLEKTMLNDARQIAAAAQQEILERPGKPVSFSIDPTTGSISGPLSAYVQKITPGTVEVDGVFTNVDDGFSLRNPRIARGRVFVFDAEGKSLPPSTH